MLYTFQARTDALPLENRLHFYELLALNLTIATRGVWSDEQVLDREKIEIMKWLNEAMHRILNHSRGLHWGNPTTTEHDMEQTLQGFIHIHPVAASYIAHAVFDSLEAVKDTRS